MATMTQTDPMVQDMLDSWFKPILKDGRVTLIPGPDPIYPSLLGSFVHGSTIKYWQVEINGGKFMRDFFYRAEILSDVIEYIKKGTEE